MYSAAKLVVDKRERICVHKLASGLSNDESITFLHLLGNPIPRVE